MWLPLRTRCSSFWLRQYLSSAPLEAKLRWASSGHQSHCSVCLVNPPHLCSAGGRQLVAAEAHGAPGSSLVPLLWLLMTAEWTEPSPESSVRRSNWSWRWCRSPGHPHLPAPPLGEVGWVGGGVWMPQMKGSWNNTKNLNRCCQPVLGLKDQQEQVEQLRRILEHPTLAGSDMMPLSWLRSGRVRGVLDSRHHESEENQIKTRLESNYKRPDCYKIIIT